ncbi:hypothetical protein ACFXO9_31785 [Nocardia tengchongensis]|uniref:hypothetical protein n=1 Tax=Nocardia tengchongensis TaxID=2055889 RepID=UPI00369EE7F6
MLSLRLTNPYDDKMVTIWLEPLGEDYWMRPGEAFTFEFDESDFSERMCGAHFDVSWANGDLVVWTGALENVWVRDQSGTGLDCGHQRPPSE